MATFLLYKFQSHNKNVQVVQSEGEHAMINGLVRDHMDVYVYSNSPLFHVTNAEDCHGNSTRRSQHHHYVQYLFVIFRYLNPRQMID